MADRYLEKLDQLEEKINALQGKEKTRLYVWIAVGVLLFVILYGIFKPEPKGDYSVIDARVEELLDSNVVLQQQVIALQEEREERLQRIDLLELENAELVNQYISNQEKHVIINQKKNEIAPTVSNLSKDSLRRLFTGK